jgi:hypothetical protein
MASLLRKSALLAITLGLGACGSSSDGTKPMIPDGKEVIYSFLSQGTQTVADEALKNVWDLGPRSTPTYIYPILWNENPFDKYWRVLFYSLRPLSNLLYAYYTTGNTAYRDKIIEVVNSYCAFDAARGTTYDAYLDDPHTAAFREMMLVNLYGKLQRSNDLPAATATAMQASIEKIGNFLVEPANFQDGQNHGFNEAAGLLVAAVNFPEMSESASWESLALTRLHGLMDDTVDDDGVEIEDSPFYHFYVLSFAAQDQKWMQAYGVPIPDGFTDRLGTMLDYATYALQPNGYLPLLGSTVTLDIRKLLPNVYDASSLDSMDGFEETSPEFTYVRSATKSGTAPTELSKRFPVSGQSFLRSTFAPHDFDDDTWISFNVGQFRSPHCHKDALAITYMSGEESLLVDSGLYLYDTVKAPNADADFFHGTSAHNTVVVDGTDQSTDSTMLSNVYPGLVTSGGTWAYQSGAHGLYAGVTHARAVVLLQQDVTLIVDSLTSTASHVYTQTWHLGPTETFTQNGLDVLASNAKGVANLAIHQAAVAGSDVQLATISGQETPTIQGWYSSEYGDRVANTALEYSVTASDQAFGTLLASEKYASLPATVNVTVAAGAAGATTSVQATVCVGSAAYDVAIQNLAAAGETVSVTPSTRCP